MGSGINISYHIYKSFLLNSGVKLLNISCVSGSGILCLFEPGSGMEKFGFGSATVTLGFIEK